MRIKPFELERYFARYEFSLPWQLSPSDCEPLQLDEVLQMADARDSAQWEQLSLGYTQSQGHPELRELVASLYHKVSEDDTLVLAPEEGIFIAMNVLLEPGQHVISTFPAYQSLYEVARSLQCRLDWWMPHKDKTWDFRPEDLYARVRPDTRMLVLNFPHNPTGALIAPETFREIVGWAEAQGIVVFSDEMYRFLEPEDTAPLPSACDLSEMAVSLGGLSKSLSLPGLRIGWLTTRNSRALVEAARFKDYTSICNSAPSERLAIIALKNRHEIWQRNRRVITDNLEILRDFFERYRGILRWLPPDAGPVAFPELTADMPVETFCFRAAQEQGVMLLPASAYAYQGNYFRISAARRNIPQALNQLEKFIMRIFWEEL